MAPDDPSSVPRFKVYTQAEVDVLLQKQEAARASQQVEIDSLKNGLKVYADMLDALTKRLSQVESTGR